jgi:prophage regulatory protein
MQPPDVLNPHSEQNMNTETPTRILRKRQVLETTGLANSTMYKYISEGRFPKPIHLGARSVGWLESEIQEWIDGKVRERAA